MAKKRKAPKRTTHKRKSRMSGASGYNDEIMLAVGSLVGGVASNMVGNNFLQGRDPKLVNMVNIGAGLFIANKAKSSLMRGIGLGMMVNGGTSFLKSTGIIRGIGAEETMTINLSGDDPADISGYYNDRGTVHSMVAGEDGLPNDSTVLGGDDFL